MERRDQLIQLSLKYQGDWSKIANGLKLGEHPTTYKLNEPCFTIYDDCYPEKLKSLRFPPWVVYYRGNLRLLGQPCITVVGSRDLCSYGRKMTQYVVEQLDLKWVIVSGLAKGVDGVAHRTAIQTKHHTIGVTGCGLDIHYPYENEDLYQHMTQHELILSEYPIGSPIQKRNFPWRNRLLASLADSIVVTQARILSGTSSTVNEAMTLGKEVWCVPYPYGIKEGEGCNLFIQQGTNILCQVSDFASIGK